MDFCSTLTYLDATKTHQDPCAKVMGKIWGYQLLTQLAYFKFVSDLHHILHQFFVHYFGVDLGRP